MFKPIKQSKKPKTFKNSFKSISNENAECIDGKICKGSDYVAKYISKKKPKKQLPKDSKVFVSK